MSIGLFFEKISLEENGKFLTIILPESSISRDTGACNGIIFIESSSPLEVIGVVKDHIIGYDSMTKFSGYQMFQALLATGNGTRTTVTETETIQTTITASAVSSTVGIGEKRA